MEKTYVISCPICGASLSYVKDELTTVCGSCKNTVYREKRPQDISLNLKYAVVSDGSTFTSTSEYQETNLSDYVSTDDFMTVEPTQLDAITVSKIDGLVYELTVNYTGDVHLDSYDKERRGQIVDEILKLDCNNIYGRFLKDIVMAEKLKYKTVSEIFTRSDALVIQDYILSFMPIHIGQEVDIIVFLNPMIKFVMHTELTSEEKYYHIMNSIKINSPFASIRPSIFENEGPLRIERIVEGYKLMLSSLIHIDVPRRMTMDIATILKDHFEGVSNYQIIKLFINYLIQSNLSAEDKLAYIQSFIDNGIQPLENFNECYEFMNFINSLGYDRYNASKLSQYALHTALPKSITFDGYAILNRFIKDSRVRFEETYRLYLRFSESLLFKQMLVQVLYSQKILDKDDMLLFVDCVAAFAKISLISEKKLSAMQLNQEVLDGLGLTTYSEMVKKYHYSKIKTLKKWAQSDKNELLLRILVEKKALLNSHKETPKERKIGDEFVKHKQSLMKSVNDNVKIAQIVACCILSIIIFANFYTDVLDTFIIVFTIIIGGIFYAIILSGNSREQGPEVLIISIVGLLVIAFFTRLASDVSGAGFAMILFVILQIPLYFLLGLVLFDPIYRLIISKDKLICEILITEERRERLENSDDKE